jgi:hypothetical protein
MYLLNSHNTHAMTDTTDDNYTLQWWYHFYYQVNNSSIYITTYFISLFNKNWNIIESSFYCIINNIHCSSRINDYDDNYQCLNNYIWWLDLSEFPPSGL